MPDGNFFRFSKPERMEYQEIVCTDRQNVPKNGFGRNRTQPNLMDVFAKFYGLEYFPSFDETRQDFNGPVYLKRIQVIFLFWWTKNYLLLTFSLSVGFWMLCFLDTT